MSTTVLYDGASAHHHQRYRHHHYNFYRPKQLTTCRRAFIHTNTLAPPPEVLRRQQRRSSLTSYKGRKSCWEKGKGDQPPGALWCGGLNRRRFFVTTFVCALMGSTLWRTFLWSLKSRLWNNFSLNEYFQVEGWMMSFSFVFEIAFAFLCRHRIVPWVQVPRVIACGYCFFGLANYFILPSFPFEDCVLHDQGIGGAKRFVCQCVSLFGCFLCGCARALISSSLVSIVSGQFLSKSAHVLPLWLISNDSMAAVASCLLHLLLYGCSWKYCSLIICLLLPLIGLLCLLYVPIGKKLNANDFMSTFIPITSFNTNSSSFSSVSTASGAPLLNYSDSSSSTELFPEDRAETVFPSSEFRSYNPVDGADFPVNLTSSHFRYSAALTPLPSFSTSTSPVSDVEEGGELLRVGIPLLEGAEEEAMDDTLNGHTETDTVGSPGTYGLDYGSCTRGSVRSWLPLSQLSYKNLIGREHCGSSLVSLLGDSDEEEELLTASLSPTVVLTSKQLYTDFRQRRDKRFMTRYNMDSMISSGAKPKIHPLLQKVIQISPHTIDCICRGLLLAISASLLQCVRRIAQKIDMEITEFGIQYITTPLLMETSGLCVSVLAAIHVAGRRKFTRITRFLATSSFPLLTLLLYFLVTSRRIRRNCPFIISLFAPVILLVLQCLIVTAQTFLWANFAHCVRRKMRRERHASSSDIPMGDIPVRAQTMAYLLSLGTCFPSLVVNVVNRLHPKEESLKGSTFSLVILLLLLCFLSCAFFFLLLFKSQYEECNEEYEGSGEPSGDLVKKRVKISSYRPKPFTSMVSCVRMFFRLPWKRRHRRLDLFLNRRRG